MRIKNSKRRKVGVLLSLFMVTLIPATCFAHPMGNFSINHYSKLTIHQSSIEIRYVIDKAEIPTFQDIRQFDITPKADDPSASRYLDTEENLLKQGILLESDGEPVRLDTVSREVTFADGAGGLATMKIGVTLSGKLPVAAGAHKLSYADNNFAGRAGWKEIVVVGDRAAILDSSASSTDRSQGLTVYSSDVLDSPPQQTSASVGYRLALLEGQKGVKQSCECTAISHGENRWDRQRFALANRSLSCSQLCGARQSEASPGFSPFGRLEDQGHGLFHTFQTPALPAAVRASAPAVREERRSTSSVKVAPALPRFEALTAVAPKAVVSAPVASRRQNTPRSRFTELISTQGKLSFWVLLSAALIASGLGALHALEPGHGKTVVAAYLVGSRGTARHAVLLGVVVTAAHTAGVYLLGAATLYASRYIVPEQLYPWLGAISGLSVVGMGVFIFLRQWTGETGEHSHTPGERHSHWFLSMFKQGAAPNPVTPTERIERPLSLHELFTLGITGGIVPCPAALVVLLSAFSLHRIGFGLFLITAFSFGLAAVLVIVGLTMVYAKRVMSSRLRRGNAAMRYLPFLSSAFMVVLGVGITVSATASVQVWKGFVPSDKLVPFASVILLGLFLGMRHSTDADHVVAVSTIVSRQKSIASSATIGLLWGLGHTLTIFLVGSAIIVFGVVIPPRLGLSMEFCVALMLILLGVLNLTGVIRWTTERFTPLKGVAARLGGGDSAQPISDEPRLKKGPLSKSFEFLRARSVGKLGVYQTVRPFVIGLVHGLAGSAAVALLVLSTIKSPLWSTFYLLVFGFGTMLGMMLMTAALSVPLVYSGKKFFSINRHLTTVSGLASMAFGIFLVYQIGFVDGLFTSQVHWIPQ